MEPLTPPQDLPYFGLLASEEPLFFRPKMRPIESLESIEREGERAYQRVSICSPEGRTLGQGDLPWSQQPRIALEYCSGNGHWIVEQAKKHPDLYWIALEKRLDRARKILSKLRFERLTNLAVACTEAKWFTRHFLADASIEALFINFPDPWPKERHQHHRLFEPTFVQQMNRILKPGAGVELTTDDPYYRDRAIEVMLSQMRPALPAPYWQPMAMSEWGYSFFAQLWLSKGRELYRTHFIRKEAAELL